MKIAICLDQDETRELEDHNPNTMKALNSLLNSIKERTKEYPIVLGKDQNDKTINIVRYRIGG